VILDTEGLHILRESENYLLNLKKMKTFKEFVAERYYQPHEPLPSGKTPYGKAVSSTYRQKGVLQGTPSPKKGAGGRVRKQIIRTFDQVKRGADNPNFNFKPDKSGQYDIEGQGSQRMSVFDKNKDIEMTIKKRDMQVGTGSKARPVYDVEWQNYARTFDENPGQARGVSRSVVDMWKNQVSPRLPANSVLRNFPVSNRDGVRNTRSKLYSKFAGFGDYKGSAQFADVNRPPSSKQAAKGVIRTTPRSSENPGARYVSYDEIDALDRSRAHKAIPTQTSPRVIAPAKPSRPAGISPASKTGARPTTGVTVKGTPRINAPKLPKLTSFKIPKLPKIKIRGGGRAAIAGALVSAGIGALSSVMSQKNKK